MLFAGIRHCPYTYTHTFLLVSGENLRNKRHMTQPPAQPGTTSHDGAAGRPFRPRSWNARTRVRFITRQQRHWLSRCPGTPTERQVALAQSIAQLAWAIALAEHAGDIGAMRDLREHVRLKDRMVADFEKMLVVKWALTNDFQAARRRASLSEVRLGPG